MNKSANFYVQPITARGETVAYGVYDSVNGIVSEHERFDVLPAEGPSGPYGHSVAQHCSVARTLAQDHCNKLNSQAA